MKKMGLTETAQFVTVMLIVAALIPRICLSASDWSYDDHHGDGPSDWKKKYPECGKSHQSPIDIRTPSTKYKEMAEIKFEGYNTALPTSRYALTNNGHTVQLTLMNGNMSISGADLPGNYKLVQFHVHWGASNAKGSEHTVDGRSLPLEIHLVHYNSDRYSNISDALKHSDGLAVIGIFAQVGNKSHSVMTKLIDTFSAVRYAGSNASNVETFAMKDLLPENPRAFYRYSGSLTTPGCQESVLWTVLKEPIKISQTQLNAFRSVGHYAKGYIQDLPMVDNFRPVQPLGSRILLRSHLVDSSLLPSGRGNDDHSKGSAVRSVLSTTRPTIVILVQMAFVIISISQ